MSLDFKPVRSNLGKQVFEYMLENIYRLNIPPGSRLGVGEIADQLGVSRSPVRDAFHLLMAEGLVEYGNTTGYQVIQIDDQYIEDVFLVRRALETAALRLTADHPDKARLGDLRARWQQLHDDSMQLDTEGYEIHINEDTLFHQSLGEMSGNHVLSDMVAKIVSRGALIRRWVYANGVPDSHLTTMAEEHLEILDAMLCGDTDRAVDLLERHLIKGQETALKYL